MDIPGTRYNSWERGFDRILEGMALSEEEKPFEAPFPLFNESDAQSAGKLMRIIRSLHRDVNNLTGVKLRLEEWVLIWETIMDTYLSPADDSGRDERDRLRLKGCFRDILNMVNELENLDYLSDRNFDFFMFKSLLTEFIQKSGGSRGRYLTQGISCASLKPLRAVPFKVIMVLGMNEESFPAADEALSFDLKETEQVRAVTSIDLSRRTSDKYSFLEVFLSAGEKVVLFYTGRNNVDNETLQPSSLIAELGTFIEDHFKVDGRENCFTALVEQEKLQPFDRDYFSDESSLFSYSKRDFELAGIYYGARRAPEAAHEIESLTPSGEGEVLEITFQDLISFLRNPLKFFFNRSCGVFMEENELKEEDTEENVDPDFFLERAFLEHILLERDLEGLGAECIGEKVEAFSSLLNGRGELIDNELSIPSVDRIKERALELLRLSGEHSYLQSKPEPVTLTFGEKTELEKGIIESPLYTLSDGTQVRVRGTLPPLYFYPDGSIVYIGILSGTSVKKSQAFAPFLINGLLPEGILRDKGLRAYLVSHEKVNLFSFPGDGEREECLPLLESYRHNLESPLPLYPEVAELIKGIDCGKAVDRKAFMSLFYDKWSDLLSGYDQNPSPFRRCPYRASAYKSLPVFNEEKMTQLYQSVYNAIGRAEPKKGRQ